MHAGHSPTRNGNSISDSKYYCPRRTVTCNVTALAVRHRFIEVIDTTARHLNTHPQTLLSHLRDLMCLAGRLLQEAACGLLSTRLGIRIARRPDFACIGLVKLLEDNYLA